MIIEQIKAQLSRLVPVHKVHDLTEEGPFVERELALVKVAGNGETRIESAAPRRHLPRPRRRLDDRELRLRDDRLGRKAQRLYRADGAARAGRGLAHRRRRDRPRPGELDLHNLYRLREPTLVSSPKREQETDARLLRPRRRCEPGQGEEGRGHRLWQPGPRPRQQSARQRRQGRRRRAAPGLGLGGEGRECRVQGA